MRRFVLLVLCATPLLVSAAASRLIREHPANGQLTCEVDAAYGTEQYGLPAAWGTGDLTFGGPYPKPAELSAAERYMLAGTYASNGASGQSLAPWVEMVQQLCLDYSERAGQLPALVSPAMVATAKGVSESGLQPEQLALYLNPFNGEFPRLDAAQFSPGDLYVRTLTEDEMRRFAQLNPVLGERWLEGQYREPGTGRLGRVSLQGGVLYIRAYGEHGVLYEQLAYELSEPVMVPQPVVSPPRASTVQSCAPSASS
jgi:hypothetical protein